MHLAKVVLGILIAVFVLVGFGIGVPSATSAAVPPRTLPSTDTHVEAASSAPAQTPGDVPVFKTSFEDIVDPSAGGITPIGNALRINTENTSYGGKAIELFGTLPCAKWSAFTVDFNIRKMTGKDMLDLSNKVFNISMFIPLGSPINGMGFWAKAEGKRVELGVNMGIARGIWNDFSFDVKKICDNQSWIGDISPKDAMEIIKNCQAIQIDGSRGADGDPMPTSLLVDDLRWIGINDLYHIPINDSVDSLRKYAARSNLNIGFGTCGGTWNALEKGSRDDLWYPYMSVQEGVMNTVWNFLPKVNEDYNSFDYSRPQDLDLIHAYKFAEGNALSLMGYEIGGLYGSRVPIWIRDFLVFPDAVMTELLYHVKKDLQFTKGKKPVWFLFNEVFLDNVNTTNGPGLRNRTLTEGEYSPWAADKNDSSLIKAAFILAKRIDPDATLMLNDWDWEDMGQPKSDFGFTFVTGLKREGIPIDGVGLQLHNFIDRNGEIIVFRQPNLPYTYCSTQRIEMDTYLNSVKANVLRYTNAGLKVAFSEVEGQIRIDDIDFTSTAGRAEYARRLQWQAKYYAGLLRIALYNNKVIIFDSFGMSDRYPGYTPDIVSGYSNGFIFDKNYNPKPAYDAMMRLLKTIN
jgi:endo-1,4-beta-xylanase